MRGRLDLSPRPAMGGTHRRRRAICVRMKPQDLYLAISARANEAAWAWRCVHEDGSWTERAEVAPGANTYRLRLLSLLDGLGHSGATPLRVHSSDAALRDLWQSWLPRWRADGWRTQTGTPLHLDLLQLLAPFLDSHTLTWNISSKRSSSHAKDAKQLARRTAERTPVDASAPPTAAPPAPEVAPLDARAATVIWADGGARGNPGGIGGWGFVMVHRPTGTTLEANGHAPDSTNNRMELTAVIEALRAIQRPGTVVEVRTDSKLVVQIASRWLGSWKRRGWRKADGEPPANLELVQALDQELQRVRAIFTWVRGHAGEPGNEHADRLANQAMDRHVRGGEPVARRRLDTPPFILPTTTDET
jgi:ribonuclease HI